MLCAAVASVKHEGSQAEHERKAESRQPDLRELGPPVSLGRDTDTIAARKVDLRGEEGERNRQDGEGCEHAGNAFGAGESHDVLLSRA
jgi:hypothetical protein